MCKNTPPQQTPFPSRLKIVFCLPGNSFSGKFIDCWTELIGYCLTSGISPVVSRKESSNVYFVRSMCLGADVTRGKHQLPFDGKIDYDYILWIDSDVIFTPQQFTRLLSYQLDIVSGVYLMSNGSQFAVVESWDEQFFHKNGCFKFLTPHDLNGKEDLIDVAYAGMGFMLVKKGVFESMEYPWFRPLEKKIGDMNDFTSEDVAFCLTAREKGFRIWVDPGVRVGHEKRVVL